MFAKLHFTMQHDSNINFTPIDDYVLLCKIKLEEHVKSVKNKDFNEVREKFKFWKKMQGNVRWKHYFETLAKKNLRPLSKVK